ncbi:MAG: hypothetical protein ACFCVG_10935 [Kineosporiaceae bacterium]
MTTVQIRTSTRDKLTRLSAERFESVDQVIAYGLALIDAERRRREADAEVRRLAASDRVVEALATQTDPSKPKVKIPPL